MNTMVKQMLTINQIESGRSEIDFSGMVDLDYKYIKDRSVLTDLKILIRTPLAVIRGDGAY